MKLSRKTLAFFLILLGILIAFIIVYQAIYAMEETSPLEVTHANAEQGLLIATLGGKYKYL